MAVCLNGVMGNLIAGFSVFSAPLSGRKRRKISLMILKFPNIASPSPSTIYLVIKCELLQVFAVLLYIICSFDSTVDELCEMCPNLGHIFCVGFCFSVSELCCLSSLILRHSMLAINASCRTARKLCRIADLSN